MKPTKLKRILIIILIEYFWNKLLGLSDPSQADVVARIYDIRVANKNVYTCVLPPM
jgi:hypothetical protein